MTNSAGKSQQDAAFGDIKRRLKPRRDFIQQAQVALPPSRSSVAVQLLRPIEPRNPLRRARFCCSLPCSVTLQSASLPSPVLAGGQLRPASPAGFFLTAVPDPPRPDRLLQRVQLHPELRGTTSATALQPSASRSSACATTVIEQHRRTTRGTRRIEPFRPSLPINLHRNRFTLIEVTPNTRMMSLCVAPPWAQN